MQAAEIIAVTRGDTNLRKVLQYTWRGWPGRVPPALQPYHVRRNELSIENGCLLWGTPVIVPTKLQTEILDELHRGHPGIVRMKALARSHVWWPSIDKHPEHKANSFTDCQVNRKAPAKAPLHPWTWPTQPWQRIHVDFAGPIAGRILLIAVDAHSKWPEVEIMQSRTSSCTISDLFAG